MNEQLPYHLTDPWTSRAAADLAAPGAAAHRVRILRWLYERGDLGGTAFEAWQETGGARPSGAGTRLGELAGPKHGFLTEKTERTRRTDTGSPAIVWQLTPAGRAYVENLQQRRAS